MSEDMYPFVPAKASEIEDGDCYFLPLSNGRYACGRILLIKKKSGRRSTYGLNMARLLAEKHFVNSE